MATKRYTPMTEYLFKVLVIGEFGVGKTSIIRRYVEGNFNPNYKLTIGVDFALKVLEWDERTKVNLQLWDIAGHERFGPMTRVYYKYAIAAIIVFDVSRPATFDSLPKWLNDVNSKVMLSDEKPVPVLLLANKCDMDDAKVDPQKMDEFCKTNNILAWFETSAKYDKNIEEAIKLLVDHILSMPAHNQEPNDHISLSNSNYEHTYEELCEDKSSSRNNVSSSCCT